MRYVLLRFYHRPQLMRCLIERLSGKNSVYYLDLDALSHFVTLRSTLQLIPRLVRP